MNWSNDDMQYKINYPYRKKKNQTFWIAWILKFLRKTWHGIDQARMTICVSFCQSKLLKLFFMSLACLQMSQIMAISINIPGYLFEQSRTVFEYCLQMMKSIYVIFTYIAFIKPKQTEIVLAYGHKCFFSELM
ncbi:hypothetical protein BDA99DRAFT_570253 [Phascolomyces articulosus]|uniref:Uncharacterized protein n=1 Tax=Phascolomyces articulosus TaxID=60185 RepID=A0AAD5KFJ7_9FUNG|nr:hypothetical protein BDA99DRAFT_570253 [Phascolomyces articulosus]